MGICHCLNSNEQSNEVKFIDEEANKGVEGNTKSKNKEKHVTFSQMNLPEVSRFDANSDNIADNIIKNFKSNQIPVYEIGEFLLKIKDFLLSKTKNNYIQKLSHENFTSIKEDEDQKQTYKQILKRFTTKIILNNEQIECKAYYLKSETNSNLNIITDNDLKRFTKKIIFSYLTKNLSFICHPFGWSLNKIGNGVFFIDVLSNSISLQQIIKKNIFEAEIDKFERISEIILSIMNLHNIGVCYNELSLENIVYTIPLREMKLKLSGSIEISKDNIDNESDFSLSKIFYNEVAVKQDTIAYFNKMRSSSCSLPLNDISLLVPPEELIYSADESEENYNKFNYYKDIWMLGVIISVLFYKIDLNLNDDHIDDYTKMKLPHIFTKNEENIYMKAFIESILLIDKNQRPDIYQVAIGFNSLITKCYNQYFHSKIPMNLENYRKFLGHFNKEENQIIKQLLE